MSSSLAAKREQWWLSSRVHRLQAGVEVQVASRVRKGGEAGSWSMGIGGE